MTLAGKRWMAFAATMLAAGFGIAVALGTSAPMPAAAGTLSTAVPVTSTTTTTTTTSAPKPKPKPARASAKIIFPDLFFVRGHAVTLPGRSFHVTGIVRPYVKGQYVRVRYFLGHQLVRSRRLLLKRSRHGAFGYFKELVRGPHPGKMTVIVTHARTGKQIGFSKKRRLLILSKQADWQSSGLFVELLQHRLASLHFYIPQTGVYDDGMAWAIDAYHRLLGWGTYWTLDGKTVSYLLNGWGQFQVRDPGGGQHAEGNLSNQLLALINGRHVYWIFPISSGASDTPTVTGQFQIYERDPGYLPDGMYYSNFFYEGFAIHGYDPAPDYPASHGCLRLPIEDAVDAYNWLNYGDIVDTYY